MMVKGRGDMAMVQNPLRAKKMSGMEKKSLQVQKDIEMVPATRNRGRTVSILDGLQRKNSQQSMRFKRVIKSSRRLNDLRHKAEEHAAKGCDGLGLGWYQT